MAYNPNIPQPTDIPSQSQAQILGNFQALSNIANSTTAYLTFTQSVSAPTVPSGQDTLFNMVSNSVAEMYVQKQSFAGLKNIPFTQSVLSTSTPGAATTGWTYLPSGILLSWGTITGNGLTSVTLNPAFPSQLITVLLTPVTGIATYENLQVFFVGSTGPNNFSAFVALNGAAGSGNFNYLAIGY